MAKSICLDGNQYVFDDPCNFFGLNITFLSPFRSSRDPGHEKFRAKNFLATYSNEKREMRSIHELARRLLFFSGPLDVRLLGPWKPSNPDWYPYASCKQRSFGALETCNFNSANFVPSAACSPQIIWYIAVARAPIVAFNASHASRKTFIGQICTNKIKPQCASLLIMLVISSGV